jgi:hypothetical protein
MTTDSPVTCSVCGRSEAEPRNIQACFECGEPFHLNPRNDVPGIDCGDAWIGESLGLEYYCQRCIDRIQAASIAGQPSPEAARHSELMQAMTPSHPGPLAAPPTTSPRRSEAPPKLIRQRARRRYRRIDR